MTKIGMYLKDVLREMNELSIGDSGDNNKSFGGGVDVSCSDRDEISDI
jgi:cyclin-D1-binding protein 1